MNRLGDTSAFVIPAGQLLLTRRGMTRMYTVGIVFELYTVPLLRWMRGVTKVDWLWDERIRGIAKVGEISKKVQERSLNWYGHVLGIEEECVGKRVMVIEVPWKRRRGSPKRKWLDNIWNGLSERELYRDETQFRINWKRIIRNIDPT